LPWDLRFLMRLFPAGDEAEIVVGDILEEASRGADGVRIGEGLPIRLHVLRSLFSVWTDRGRQFVRGGASAGLRTELLASFRLLWRRPVLAWA